MITYEHSTGWAAGVSYEAEPGDTIKLDNVTWVIERILHQEYWSRFGFDIEFIDTRGKYHHWKEYSDNGEFIPKKPKYVNMNNVDCTDIFRKFGYC